MRQLDRETARSYNRAMRDFGWILGTLGEEDIADIVSDITSVNDHIAFVALHYKKTGTVVPMRTMLTDYECFVKTQWDLIVKDLMDVPEYMGGW